MNVIEFIPMHEPRTIERAQLRALLKALHEVTMLKHIAVLCDSKYLVDGCNGIRKWQHNNWRMTSTPVAHADLWKPILVLLNVYGAHVTVHRVPSLAAH